MDAVDRSDVDVLKRTIEVMYEYQPQLMMVHFKGPDYHGHHNNWQGYLESIVETDSLLFELINTCGEMEFYKDRTSIIMTNDHGRHLDGIAGGFSSHGDHCLGCTHINFMAYGPDFKKDFVSDRQAQSIDLLPTIGELMGFRVPWTSGRVLDEIFK